MASVAHSVFAADWVSIRFAVKTKNVLAGIVLWVSAVQMPMARPVLLMQIANP